MEALFEILQDPDIIKYSTEYRYTSVAEVRNVYLIGSDNSFKNKSSLSYIIENISSGQVVGYREVYVDNNKEYVTIQGFTHPKYRKSGVSKESYQILIEFLKSFSVKGIIANAKFSNFPSMALLCSIGFEQTYLSEVEDEIVGVFELDLENIKTNIYINSNYLVKRIYTFCTMYLGAQELAIESDTPIKYDDYIRPGYQISLTTANWLFSDYPVGIIRKMKFLSSGVVITTGKSGLPICLIDGRVSYIDAWAYCWELCTFW